MKVVSDRLGHASMAITANLYTHVTPAPARDAAQKIGAPAYCRSATKAQRKYSANRR
jgi:hypothetical protein